MNLGRVVEKIVGEKFSRISHHELILIILYFVEKRGLRKSMSDDFIHSLIYLLKKDGIPLPYRFERMGNELFSIRLKEDLEYLRLFGYIMRTSEGKLKLTPKGEDEARILYTSILSSEERSIIEKFFIPIDKLLKS